MIRYTICEDCPCLNNDYESGSSCNLGYETDLEWFDKKTHERVEDTPEMRSHQGDFNLYSASLNCGLVVVKTIDRIIYPNLTPIR